MDTISVKILRSGAKLPTYGTDHSAGADLYACLDAPVTIAPGQTVLIPTGLAMALPKGYGGFVFARSGLGIRHGVVPGNCVGVIDADYRGEVLVGLHNHSDTAYTIQPGERIAQLVVLETPMWEAKEVDSLDDTDRGTGGFGSTGSR